MEIVGLVIFLAIGLAVLCFGLSLIFVVASLISMLFEKIFGTQKEGAYSYSAINTSDDFQKSSLSKEQHELLHQILSKQDAKSVYQDFLAGQKRISDFLSGKNDDLIKT